MRLLEFLNSRHINVARLSAFRTDRLCASGHKPPTHFCQKSTPGTLCSWKNFNEHTGNPPRNLPACSAVPDSTRHRVAHPHTVNQRITLKETEACVQKWIVQRLSDRHPGRIYTLHDTLSSVRVMEMHQKTWPCSIYTHGR